MNKTFKSVWNESTGTYVAASEDTPAAGRKTSSTRAGKRMPRRSASKRLVLEPRIVFDGALPVAAADAVESKADTATKEASVAPPTTNAPPSESTLQPTQSAQQERAVIDGTLALDGQASNEIIFIDSAVEGLQNFLLDHPQADVVLIDAGSDGMEQIAATLEGRTDIEAIHILSHGSSGQLNLGDSTFNLQSMNGEHADELATIKSALSAEADILIYGCDVGAEQGGQDFISALSGATGADIAASTDLTGAAGLGGDWDLESKTGTLETDAFSLKGFAGVLLDPVVDLNSDPTVTVTGPVDTVTTATTNLVNTGDFGTTAGQVPPAPWQEIFGPNNGQVVLDGSGDGRYNSTQDDNWLQQAITVPADTTNTTVTSSSTGTATTDVSTTVTTTNEISSISFDIAWQNADITSTALTGDSNILSISYDGVVYARFDTTNGGGLNQAGLVGNWTYFNGASGPATTTSVTDEVTGALTNITINLPTGITGSGLLILDNWNAGLIQRDGSDDIAIDNVVVNNTETTTTSVTTTVTTADTADNDWTATFTENGPAVSIADIDSSIFDGDSTNMQSAAITLTNQATGDRLLVNGSAAASGTLASGIAWTRTDTSVSFSGSFTKAQYADAIELVQFENTTDNPSATARVINVTVNDGSQDSNVAVATINVTQVDDAPVNNVPGAQAATEDVTHNITGISVTDLDAGNPTEVASTVLSVGSGTLNLTAAGSATLTNNGTGSVTITGNAADINATLLNNVDYLGNANFNGTDTLTVLTTDAGGANSDTDTVTINVGAGSPVGGVVFDDRLPIEPEWFLNTDVINREIFKWQIANDPTSPVLSTINDIRKETALNSGLGVFQTDSTTKAELTAGSDSDNAAPSYVQNSVRHLDLDGSSASIQQAVKASQLESTANEIRAVSADNTAIPAVSNIIDPFTEKGFKQPDTEEDPDANTNIRPALPEKQLNKESEENIKSRLNTEDSKIKSGYTIDSDPNTKLDQKDGAVNKDSSETSIIKEKSAKSFSNQLQHMATNTRSPSNDMPSNK